MEASDLAARARTVAQLADIVRAMRTLASARRRQAQERFSGLERYATSTRAVLQEALGLLGAAGEGPSLAAPSVRRVVLLFSEHGFVGALNDRLLDAALERFPSRGAELVAVGGRGRRLCRERGVDASDGGAMPTTVAAVQSTAQRLIESQFDDVAEGRLGELHVVFAAHQPPVSWEPRVVRLFPPEVTAEVRPAALGPIHMLEPRALAARAVEEYAFAQVSWAVGSAFASEQAARFVSMDAARRHVEEKLAELGTLERRLRQEAVTNEILEIAAGSESSEVAS